MAAKKRAAPAEEIEIPSDESESELGSSEENDGEEHGPKLAAYKNTGVNHEPTFVCLCGDVFVGDSWEEAGAEFDEHLADVEP
jgi:hypothetical protein